MRSLHVLARMKLAGASNRVIAKNLRVDEGTIRNRLKLLKAIAEYSAQGGDMPADEQGLALQEQAPENLR
jgi:predicted transcriptional regulator